jgi:predicted nucleotidyltransferase
VTPLPMTSPRDVRERLRALFEAMRLEGGLRGVVSIYLFGSHAEHRAHRESDVDVGVLLDRDVFVDARSRFEARLIFSTRFQAAVATAVDVVILQDAPPLLGRHVVTRGERLFCADPLRDRDFVRDVQLRAADLEPFLRRMQRIKLEAIAR